MSKRNTKKQEKDSAKADKSAKPSLEEEIKSVVEEGIPTIDSKVPNADKYTIMKEGLSYLSCYLMWSDVKDNHNKFYVC
jgi:hypothetical protein